MKIRRDGLRNVLLGSLLLVGAGAGVETASAQGVVSAGIHVGPSGRASVDLGFFYDDLAPYGNWIERPSYGWVWTPRAVASSWRPYQNGHWVFTDEGWVWITDEPYGWATYHYGRWYDDPELGWSWVPGDTWGPSWVSFQEGGDYIGWAPLPPGVDVALSLGGGYGGYAYGIAPAAYLFVPERDFLAPRLGGYYVGQDRVGQFWGQTRNFTNYRFQGGSWYNQGVPVDRIQRFGRVPRYQVADVAANFRQRGGRIEGNRLAMFRPQVQRTARLVPPNQRPAARRAVVSAAQFRATHGDRVAFAQRMGQQNRLAAQAAGRQPQRFAQQQRQQQGAVQRQARTAQIERQRVAQAQRQTRNTRSDINVAQRQAQANRQMERRQLQVNRQQQQRQAQASRQMGQRQFQANRQQERRQAQVNRQQQQRQVQVSQQRERGAQQRQAQMARQQQRQVQMGRQQQRQFAQQQQRQNRPPQQANPNRGGGPGRQQGQPGRNNNRQHPGPGGQ